jgi:hypothetical protein
VHELDEMGSMQVQCVGTGHLEDQPRGAGKDHRRAAGSEAARQRRYAGAVADKHYNFFSYGPLQEGEDYMFCDLWRSVGGEVWIAPNIEVTHVGEKEYVGRFGDQLVPVHARRTTTPPQNARPHDPG